MIPIRPEVAMYAAFARLNYKQWFALAEFVDNSLQSALANMDALRRVHGDDYKLKVEVVLTDESIEIRDNAAGIAERDYARAFLPASPPPDRSGLSEFGLGMKAAACWFARKWSVRTSALGEPHERTITFDIPHIVETSCDALEPANEKAEADDHYTTLTLWDLQKRATGRTLGKVRDHLRSIYRLFLRDGVLELTVGGEKLTDELPEILVARHYAKPDSKPVTWRKEFEYDLGDGHRIRGWAALLAKGSVANAGFSIFRRRRLIEGSHGDGYRPQVIFGTANKYTYQRLIGEIEIEGFSVSHTKDGVQWEDWEDDMLAWVKSKLNEEPKPLLTQAENFRTRKKKGGEKAAETAAFDTSSQIAQSLAPVVEEQLDSDPVDDPLPEELDEIESQETNAREVRFELEHHQTEWKVLVELVLEPGFDPWYDVAEAKESDDVTFVHIRMNIAHPFMRTFETPDGDELVPFTRIAAALAVSEVTARRSGVELGGTMRLYLNQLLRKSFSGPVTREEKSE